MVLAENEVMVLIKDGPRFRDAMRAIRSMAELHTPHDMTTAQMIEEFWQGFAPMFGCEVPRVVTVPADDLLLTPLIRQFQRSSRCLAAG